MPNLKKLRIRLTAVNTLVLIGVLCFVPILLSLSVNFGTERNVGDTLKIYATQISTNLLVKEQQTASGVTSTNDPLETLLQQFEDSGIAYVVWDEDFQKIEQSQWQPLTDTQLYTLVQRYFFSQEKDFMLNDFKADTLNLKICTLTTLNADGNIRVIQIVKDMQAERLVLDNSVSIFFLSLGLSATISILVGYFLSGHSLKPIQKSMDQQQQFLADASHELRTPIAVIQTDLDILKKTPDPEEQQRWLDTACSEAVRMQRIVEDLMFLARSDAGEEPYYYETVDVAYLMLDASERFSNMAAQRGMTIQMALEEMDLLVQGDEGKINQVLTILIDNAIKYAGEMSTIYLSAAHIEDHVELVVRDTGCGIKPEDLEKIFQRFYRVDKARSREAGGTGLGLPIAKKIIEQHGGTLTAKSQEGSGTAFTIKLPYLKEKEG